MKPYAAGPRICHVPLNQSWSLLAVPRLHQKVATTIFFESNGGQAEATIPEIRLAVAEPELDVGNVGTAEFELSALRLCRYCCTYSLRYYKFLVNVNRVCLCTNHSLPLANGLQSSAAKARGVPSHVLQMRSGEKSSNDGAISLSRRMPSGCSERNSPRRDSALK